MSVKSSDLPTRGDSGIDDVVFSHLFSHQPKVGMTVQQRFSPRMIIQEHVHHDHHVIKSRAACRRPCIPFENDRRGQPCSECIPNQGDTWHPSSTRGEPRHRHYRLGAQCPCSDTCMRCTSNFSQRWRPYRRQGQEHGQIHDCHYGGVVSGMA